MDKKLNTKQSISKHLKAYFIISMMGVSATFGKDQVPVYTWKECLEFAIKNNPELSAALSKVQSSEYSKEGTKANFLPTVSASISKTKTTSETEGQDETSSDRYSASLNASVNLFNGLRDYNLLTQADANIEVAKAQYVKTSASILYALKSAFENYRYA